MSLASVRPAGSDRRLVDRRFYAAAAAFVVLVVRRLDWSDYRRSTGPR